MQEQKPLSPENLAFLEALYEQYQHNPGSVSADFRALFSEPVARAGQSSAQAQTAGASHLVSDDFHGKVEALIENYRKKGHLIADLDPLKLTPMSGNVQDLKIEYYNLTERDLDRATDTFDLFDQSGEVTLRDVLNKLRRTYCQRIGYEYTHLQNAAELEWLKRRIEGTHGEALFEIDATWRERIVLKLSQAESFEQYLHKKYVGVKRFALSGGEALIPMLDALIERAGGQGVGEVVMGMAHRGRLNVLTNICGKTLPMMLSEFEGLKGPTLSTLATAHIGTMGDVKYHMGFSGDYPVAGGKKVHVTMAFNPSHLEFINPVVEGRARAKQDRIQDTTRSKVLPLLLHGDAAFMGQGVVMETLNLAGLKGFTTGGTVHIIVNNQVGFTTNPSESRFGTYASELAKFIAAPIIHVNGDDAESCVKAVMLAFDFRQAFHRDVVIDLICYRRYGHNEGDEPSFTQPLMYQAINKHPSPRKAYVLELAKAGLLSEAAGEAVYESCLQAAAKAHEEMKKNPPPKGVQTLGGVWKSYQGGLDSEAAEVATSFPMARLQALAEHISTIPSDFEPHPKVKKLMETRAAMGKGEVALDWGMGEALAHATLVDSGTRIRLTGQDVRRGTFSSRHAVMICQKSGRAFCQLAQLGQGKGIFEIHDSSLCETGLLGFEFGYSLDTPEALVVWEGQFGDFVNVAQVIIDQFISSSESKWSRLSGLTLLLPHGYEGQGPEHSSARLERFLQLCADDNMQVCNFSTPAQIFHALRRQVLRPYRKPLIIMSPKSLLRHPRATSTLDELATGTFQRLIPDSTADKKSVSQLLLCSGKIYYDLAEAREKRADQNTAIVRIEQLYPFPQQQLSAIIQNYPKLQSVKWVQEEAENMGAAWFVEREIRQRVPKIKALTLIARKVSASPAVGSKEVHDQEQADIVQRAFERA